MALNLAGLSRYSGVSRNSSPAVPGGAPQAAVGRVPDPTPMPTPYEDLARYYPNLGGTTAQVSNNISNQLAGQLSPDTVAMLQDRAASFGVANGMPGMSGGSLPVMYNLRSLGIAAEDMRNQGIQNFASVMPAMKNAYTVDPSLQAEITTLNNQLRAAPDPKAAQDYSEQLFSRYMDRISGGAGGGGASGSGGAGGVGGGRIGGSPASGTGTGSSRIGSISGGSLPSEFPWWMPNYEGAQWASSFPGGTPAGISPMHNWGMY